MRSIIVDVVIITCRVRRSQREMHIGHGRLCVCVTVCMSVPRRIPTLLHRSGCNLWRNGGGALYLCTIGRICNRCTGLVAVTTAPNAKCQRVLVLALCLAYFIIDHFSKVKCLFV